MSALQAYLLGLITIPALVFAVFLLLVAYAFVARFLTRSGWFAEFGEKAPEPCLSTRGLVAITRRHGPVVIGHWVAREALGRAGSRWVQVGPICIGRKDGRLVLSEEVYRQMRADENARRETTA